MRQFSFAAVDTPCGRLSLSVSYIPVLEDVSSQPSPPLSTELITDYVGSPTTDPLKKFTRRHSWSVDRAGMPLVSPSLSHAYSDSRPLRYTPPDHSDSDLGARIVNAGFDENWPSPPFSVSPTPSPPVHFRGGHTPNNLFRAESAPVSIPLPQLGKSGGLVNYGLPPSSSRKVTKTGFSSYADASPDGKPRMKKESRRFLEYQSDSSLQKVLSIGREDIASLSGLCSSPHIPFSRSPSRLTFLDEFDDPEFTYPFAVDDVDLADTGNRIKPYDARGHERGNSDNRGLLLDKMSPDAAIGALVRMFKAAPPLQRDLSNSVSNMQVSIDEIWSDRVLDDKGMGIRVEKLDIGAPNVEIAASGLFKSKTAADAFVELRHYKELKEQLLRQGGLPSLGTTEH